ncbi:MAG TPA: hypothetical protein VGD41_14155, partial [Pyrinomonadaceae bacterium]
VRNRQRLAAFRVWHIFLGFDRALMYKTQQDDEIDSLVRIRGVRLTMVHVGHRGVKEKRR